MRCAYFTMELITSVISFIIQDPGVAPILAIGLLVTPQNTKNLTLQKTLAQRRQGLRQLATNMTRGLYHKTNYSSNKLNIVVSQCICLSKQKVTAITKPLSLLHYGINYFRNQLHKTYPGATPILKFCSKFTNLFL